MGIITHFATQHAATSSIVFQITPDFDFEMFPTTVFKIGTLLFQCFIRISQPAGGGGVA
jgi:hypothetical protein